VTSSVSARKSYIDWLLREIDPEVTGTFGFIDAQAKAVYDIRPRHTLQVHVVAGRSRFDEREETLGPTSLEIGLHRAVLASVALRSTLSGSAILTQRVYGVVSRFGNHNDGSRSRAASSTMHRTARM
jgi:hypothetical protein